MNGGSGSFAARAGYIGGAVLRVAAVEGRFTMGGGTHRPESAGCLDRYKRVAARIRYDLRLNRMRASSVGRTRDWICRAEEPACSRFYSRPAARSSVVRTGV